MLPILPFLQDVAGENCTIAPFAKTSPKNIFLILCSVYNSEGELVQVVMSDYSQSQGKTLDFKHSLGYEGSVVKDFQYDNNGVVQIYREGRYLRGETPVLMMQNRLRYKEVHNDGFLALRRDSKSTQVESYKYDIENYSIEREWRNERFGVLYVGQEQYDEEGKILIQKHCEINLNNSNEIVMDEKYEYFYKEGIVSHIISQVILKDRIQITKLGCQEFDEQHNPLVIREYNVDGGDALLYTKEYEYAYDAETARVLQAKFDSQKNEIWRKRLETK